MATLVKPSRVELIVSKNVVLNFPSATSALEYAKRLSEQDVTIPYNTIKVLERAVSIETAASYTRSGRTA